MSELVARLPRARRRRPPTGRALVLMIWCVVLLADVARTTIEVASGEWWELVFVVVYAVMFSMFRRLLRIVRDAEDRDTAIPPVQPIEITFAALVVVVCVWNWAFELAA